jgi:UPF0755 protein
MKDDEQRAERAHRKRVENFRLQIKDDMEGLSGQDIYSHGLDAEQSSASSISSYSEMRPDDERQAEAQRRFLELHRMRNREKGRKNKRFFRFVWFVMVFVHIAPPWSVFG